MNRLNYVVGGGRTLLAICLAIVISFSTGITSAYAYDNGDTVSYTAGHDASDNAVFSVGDYKGRCAQAGVPVEASGTATVRKINNNSRVAKLVYQYDIVKGWGANCSDYMGPGTLQKGHYLSSMIQLNFQGYDAWADGARIGSGYTDEEINAVYTYINGIDDSSIRVPSSFEMYYCDAGNGQHFVIYRINPSGFIKLKKSSANTGITG